MPWLPQNDGQPSNWQEQPPEASSNNPAVPPEDENPSIWQQQTPEGTSMTQAEYEATVSAQEARDAAIAARDESAAVTRSALVCATTFSRFAATTNPAPSC